MKKNVKVVPFSCHCKLNDLIAHLKTISAELQEGRNKKQVKPIAAHVYMPAIAYSYSTN